MPKVIATKVLERIWPGVHYSRISPAQFADLPDPPLPGPRWIRVENRLCGICASDLHILFVDADPGIHPVALPGFQRIYLGHEVVSRVVEVGPRVTRLRTGDRVVMQSRFMGPTCFSQEIEPVCRHCTQGNYALCENQSAGVGPRGVGGGWGDGYTAHETEVWRVPDDLSDDQAVLVEPLAVGLHAVLRRPPQPGEKLLIVGSGIIGLTTLQAARALCPDCHITAIARYPYQQETARKLGADEVVRSEDPYPRVAEITGAKLYRGQFGNCTLLGGFDVVYDCVGSSRTLQDSLRWTRAGGTLLLIGTSLNRLKVDLTPVWHQEVDVIGAIAHGVETWQGERVSTFDLVARLLREGRLTHEGLITHRFPLEQWRDAIEVATHKRRYRSIKVVFDYSLDS
ncbi:MAG TPA: hypothetical protein EYH31_09040 [Anaerolineae bacterium]|nr:hypothetical protein [Anaerolineae bacterium]